MLASRYNGIISTKIPRHIPRSLAHTRSSCTTTYLSLNLYRDLHTIKSLDWLIKQLGIKWISMWCVRASAAHETNKINGAKWISGGHALLLDALIKLLCI